MNDVERVKEELEKIERYAEILESPDEFFIHMNGHTTELSLVLSAFSIAEMSKNIKAALEKQIQFINNEQYEVFKSVLNERHRQDSKWGEQNHPPGLWTGILGEEYGEFCEAVNETVFDNGTDKGGYENMKKEAIHVAAVAIGFIEYLERNKKTSGGRRR